MAQYEIELFIITILMSTPLWISWCAWIFKRQEPLRAGRFELLTVILLTLGVGLFYYAEQILMSRHFIDFEHFRLLEPRFEIASIASCVAAVAVDLVSRGKRFRLHGIAAALIIALWVTAIPN